MSDREDIGGDDCPTRDIESSCEGFTPTSDARRTIDARLARMHRKCPSGSLLSAAFARGDDGYQAQVRVRSLRGPFSSEARAPDLWRCLDLLEERLLAEFGSWRASRFQDEPAQAPAPASAPGAGGDAASRRRGGAEPPRDQA